MDKQRIFNEMLRGDFPAFLKKTFQTIVPGEPLSYNWHLDAIAWQLQRIGQGDTTRLIVNMPPRHLKTITISVAWVAWMLGRDPTLNFVCVSYSNEFATKPALDCRKVMQSDWYTRAFPRTVLERTAVNDLTTTMNGGRLATSVGGTLTGRGGDIIVIDDPINADDALTEAGRNTVREWFSSTLTSRLNDKNKGAIVLVMQRLHEDDLAGHLLEAGGWEHLNLPAVAEVDEMIETGKDAVYRRSTGDVLHPERMSRESLERERASMGSARFSAQYQQAPVPAGGTMIQRDWLQRWKIAPERQSGDQIVQSWDTASKEGVMNDWSVCVTALVRKRRVYVLDVFRRRMMFPELLQKVGELARRYEGDAF